MTSAELPRTLGVLQRALFVSAPPVSIGRFEVRRQLGRGAMGVVYLAHDPDLRREVAIKVHRGGAETQGGPRLRREAESLARLRHRNVVQVFEVGQTGRDEVFVVMEYLPGLTLRAWIERDAPCASRIVEVFVRCAWGLHAAHDQGLVHRDFKPDNVIIGDELEPHIIDFGLARGKDAAPVTATEPESRDADERITQAGVLAGTPRYMAPELWDGRAPSPASDQFAFAVALYECLAGFPPYVERRFAERVVRPRRLGRATWAVLRRALDPLPRRRWPSMASLAERLAAVASTRSSGRRSRVAGVATLAVGGGALALAAFWPTTPAAVERRVAPCEPGTDLLAPSRVWQTNGPLVRRDDAGLHVSFPAGPPSYFRAELGGDPMSFRDRAIEFDLARLPQLDTTNEVFLSLRNAEDEPVSILVWGGGWVFPMAPNTHGLALPIDRTRDLSFRIQVQDQKTVADIVTFEFSADRITWTPIARVEGSVGEARVVIEGGSHDPIAFDDAAIVSRVQCTALQPVGTLSEDRDRARVER